MAKDKSEEATESQKTNPVAPESIKAGDLMAFTYWAKVKTVDQIGEKLYVSSIGDEGPGDFAVSGRKLVTSSYSADFFAEEVKASKTKVAGLLTNSFNQPFSVCFIKADGSERILRGRLLSTEPLLGRSYCDDMDVAGSADKRIRLVDHRSLLWLVVSGVKYVVK